MGVTEETSAGEVHESKHLLSLGVLERLEVILALELDGETLALEGFRAARAVENRLVSRTRRMCQARRGDGGMDHAS